MAHPSRMRSSLLLGVASSAVVLIAPARSQAQVPTPTTPPAVKAASPGSDANASNPNSNNQRGGSLPVVIVTAEKRTANIQNVAIEVTAFTSKQRALEGINSVQDLTNFTPGLTYSSQLDRPAMRGLARSTNTYTADSSVGVYDNDLFTNSTFLVGRDDMIVDQVEVLEGPQNTLYGRNAIGGIINTQSKRPSEVFGGEIREEFGNYGYNKIEATITGPLSFINPNLTFRFSGYYDEQDHGWIRNVSQNSLEGTRHDPYEELQLQYKTDQDTVWLMMYNLTFNHDRGGPGAALAVPEDGPYDTALVDTSNTLFYNPNAAYNPANIVPGTCVGCLPGAANPTTTNRRSTATNFDTTINVDAAFSFNFHWTHHFDGFDVKYVGGYSQYHYTLQTDNYLNGDTSVKSYELPVAPLSVVPPAAGNFCGLLNAVGGVCNPAYINFQQSFNFDTQTDWFSHELDFTSTSNGRFSWIGGLYYYNETDAQPDTEQAALQPQLNGATFNVIPLTGALGYVPTLFGTLAGGAPPATAIYNPSQAGDYLYLNYQDRVQTSAVFVQGSYKILDTVKATIGLRYTYDYKNAQEEARYLSLAGIEPAAILGQFTPAVDITPALVSFAPGKGIASPVSFPTAGKYAGDAVRKLADHSDAVTGTAALEWTPDKDTLAYARYNRGYKAFALNSGYVGANPEAAPEFVNDYEVGLKETLGRTLQIDVNGFYYDYSNDQTPLAFPIATPVGPLNLSQFVNIPKAVSDGIEMSILWSPVAHLNFSLTYGLDHTEILTGCETFTKPLTGASPTCFINGSDPLAIAQNAKPAGPSSTGDVFQSVKGNPLPQAPENKIALNTTYTLFFDPGNLTLSGSYIWRDHSYSDLFGSRSEGFAPSWSQVDLRATWSGNHDKYEIVAYVKNLFNTLGYDAAAAGFFNAAPAGGGAATFNEVYDLTPPRLFGAEIHYKF